MALRLRSSSLQLLAFAYPVLYAYHSVQRFVWPDVVAPATEPAAVGYAALNALAPNTPAVTRWRPAYTRHIYCEQPALMSALWLTAFPDRLDRHVTYAGETHIAALRERPAVIALSRTSMSQAVLWALARRGLRAAVIVEPSMSVDESAAIVRRWGYDADTFTFIPADRRSLLRVRDALREGRSVIVYPESHTADGAQADVVPFLATDVRAPAGVAAMAARFAVPVVPMRASIVRRRVVIEAAPPLEPAAFADAPALNRALFAALARWVRERPEQWVGWEYLTPAE